MSLMTESREKIVQYVLSDLHSFFIKRHLGEYFLIEEKLLDKSIRFMLLFLKEAVLFSNPDIFRDNLLWFFKTNTTKRISHEIFIEALISLKKVLNLEGDEVFYSNAVALIDKVLAELPTDVQIEDSYLLQPDVETELSTRYLESLINHDKLKAEQVIEEFLQKKGDLRELFKRLIQPVQYEVGRLWQQGLIDYQQEHYCTQTGQGIIAGLMSKQKVVDKDKCFMGIWVGDEHHSAGVKMVGDYFILSGWNAVLMSGYTDIHEIVKEIKQKSVLVVGISVTMPYNLHKASELIMGIKKLCKKNRPKIIVGGAVFNNYSDLWKKVGADKVTKSAEEAFEYAKELFQ